MPSTFFHERNIYTNKTGVGKLLNWQYHLLKLNGLYSKKR